MLVVQSIMDINEELHKCSINLLMERLEILVLIQDEKSLRTKNLAMNYTDPSLKKSETQNMLILL